MPGSSFILVPPIADKLTNEMVCGLHFCRRLHDATARSYLGEGPDALQRDLKTLQIATSSPSQQQLHRYSAAIALSPSAFALGKKRSASRFSVPAKQSWLAPKRRGGEDLSRRAFPEWAKEGGPLGSGPVIVPPKGYNGSFEGRSEHDRKLNLHRYERERHQSIGASAAPRIMITTHYKSIVECWSFLGWPLCEDPIEQAQSLQSFLRTQQWRTGVVTSAARAMLAETRSAHPLVRGFHEPKQQRNAARIEYGKRHVQQMRNRKAHQTKRQIKHEEQTL